VHERTSDVFGSVAIRRARLGERLSIDVTVDGDEATITVAGDLDVDTVAQLDHALGQIDGASLSLDLGRVTFCDSRALECLIRNKVAFRDHHRAFRLVRVSHAVEQLLDITATDRFFADLP
jgi:anti-anti-sigma factor